MAKTKAGGSSRLGRDSQPKYLGIKRFAGQPVEAGQILVRQRGAKVLAGKNVRKGGDDTLYAAKPGIVHFLTKNKKGFNGSQRVAKVVEIR
ncbi:MAG: 50S ribosomal protein L27 [Candidatus Nealsonbacteria bacterium]|nr:50S ribosomal protein L27 [Candidatus Nealsonbacteria bacterium]